MPPSGAFAGVAEQLLTRHMHMWRLFYWVRLLAALFAIFIIATAALDVSLAPEATSANPTPTSNRAAVADELPEFEQVVHEGATDDVGGWLSIKVDDGLNHLEGLRLEVRELGSRIGDAVGL